VVVVVHGYAHVSQSFLIIIGITNTIIAGSNVHRRHDWGFPPLTGNIIGVHHRSPAA
jgi:hypothetical protein